MQISKIIEKFIDYHRLNSKKNTIRNYAFVLHRFDTFSRNRQLSTISLDDILSFLKLITDGCRQSTKKLRYTNLKSFFNFVKDAIDPAFENPCESPILKKAFKDAKPDPWVILDKETVDEIIFRTLNQRDRLMLELMARGGLRISEVLKFRATDAQGQKLILRTPKSGKHAEVAYIPKKVADRLNDHIIKNEIDPKERVIPLSYTAARRIVVKLFFHFTSYASKPNQTGSEKKHGGGFWYCCGILVLNEISNNGVRALW